MCRFTRVRHVRGFYEESEKMSGLEDVPDTSDDSESDDDIFCADSDEEIVERWCCF